MKFYDRENELKLLDGAVSGKNSEMVVITGRRRIGKTRLVEEFMKKHKGARVFIVPKEDKQVASDFRDAFKTVLDFSPEFTSVKDALEFYFNNPKIRILHIDEFSNFLEVDEAIPHEVQRLWDRYKNKTDKILLFSGSYVGMMNKIFTRRKAPLFNRAGISILLKPLDIKTIWKMQTDLGVSDADTKISNYCIFGGVPYYYELIEKRKKKDSHSLVKSLFFEVGAPLREEGQNILRQEFGSAYKKYFSIMEAIGAGIVSGNNISNKLGISQTTLSKYIIALQRDFSLVERSIPFSESPARSKKGIYSIPDNTIAFWFSHVFGKEEPPPKEILERFISKRYEHFCSAFFTEYLKSKGETILRSGSWWGNVRPGKKSEPREIDLVFETREKLYIGECKWKNKSTGEKELDWLEESSRYIMGKTRKEARYVLFSKEGFSFKPKENTLLFDSGAVDRFLR